MISKKIRLFAPFIPSLILLSFFIWFSLDEYSLANQKAAVALESSVNLAEYDIPHFFERLENGHYEQTPSGIATLSADGKILSKDGFIPNLPNVMFGERVVQKVNLPNGNEGIAYFFPNKSGQTSLLLIPTKFLDDHLHLISKTVSISISSNNQVISSQSPIPSLYSKTFNIGDLHTPFLSVTASYPDDLRLSPSKRNIPLRALALTLISAVLFFIIHTNRKLGRQLERDHLMAKLVFDSSNDAIVITDAKAKIISVNPAFTTLTGYPMQDVIGQDPKILSSGQTHKAVYKNLWDSLNLSGHWEGELIDRRKDGSMYSKWLKISTIRDEDGKPDLFIGTFFDMTHIKRAEAEAVHLARHDPLTSLPNRLSFNEKLAEISTLTDHPFALMLIDLDRFKHVNDTLGHAFGDALLISVSTRLRETLRDCDFVARLGGDEFVVIVPIDNESLDPEVVATTVASKIVISLSEPHCIDGNSIISAPSIGVCVFPTQTNNPADLLQRADVAMYSAKADGRGRFKLFRDEMLELANRRASIETSLRSCLQNPDTHFKLVYQPQIEPGTGLVPEVEALVRWISPELGFVSPMEFIPVAEETGLVIPLGQWIFDKACSQSASWMSQGFPIRVAVNISAVQFSDPTLHHMIETTLTRHSLPGEMISIEITESASMIDPDHTVSVMESLASLGCHLALDDFGAGYSSFAYLRAFPAHTVKIDKVFVNDIEHDIAASDVCESLVFISHKLGKEVVAEGVETPGQLAILEANGCERIQGYLFSKPIPAEDIIPFMQNISSTNVTI